LINNIGEMYEGNYLIVNYVLSTGQKGTLPLNKTQSKYFLECIDMNKTMVLQVGDEIRTLNPMHLAFTYIKGLNVSEILIEQQKKPDKENFKAENKIQIFDSSEQLAKAYTDKEKFQIECKCGAEYIKEYGPLTQKNSCSECNVMIFVDRKRGKQERENGEFVWIMTNKYYVDRTFTYPKL
jgi:hypothetical protein